MWRVNTSPATGVRSHDERARYGLGTTHTPPAAGRARACGTTRSSNDAKNGLSYSTGGSDAAPAGCPRKTVVTT